MYLISKSHARKNIFSKSVNRQTLKKVSEGWDSLNKIGPISPKYWSKISKNGWISSCWACCSVPWLFNYLPNHLREVTFLRKPLLSWKAFTWGQNGRTLSFEKVNNADGELGWSFIYIYIGPRYGLPTILITAYLRCLFIYLFDSMLWHIYC